MQGFYFMKHNKKYSACHPVLHHEYLAIYLNKIKINMGMHNSDVFLSYDKTEHFI